VLRVIRRGGFRDAIFPKSGEPNFFSKNCLIPNYFAKIRIEPVNSKGKKKKKNDHKSSIRKNWAKSCFAGEKGCCSGKSVLPLADCEWRVAAAGLKPLRLPRTQLNKLCPVDVPCQSNAD